MGELVKKTVDLRTNWASKELLALFTSICPEEADYILENLNTHNRTLKKRAIKRYAEDMEHGRWRCNGEAIKFDKSGILLDGQNRLAATIKVDRLFFSLIVLGLEKESQDTMDSHVKRTLGDSLKLRGETNYRSLAAVIAFHWRWLGRGDITRNDAVSTPEALEWLSAHPDLRMAYSRYSRLCAKPTAIPGSVVGAFGYEAGSIDGWKTSDNFWDAVYEGGGLRSDDPCFLLREWFIRRTTMPDTRGRPNASYCLAVTIKAWNAFVKGSPITSNGLRWRVYGKGAESFPEMIRDIY